MFIRNIFARNVLSFGPDGQGVNNCDSINLFIGRNGSGKSNLLKLINKIGIEHKQVKGSTPIRQGPKVYIPPIFIVKLKSDFICDRSPYFADCGEVVIDFTAKGKNSKTEEFTVKFDMDTLIFGDVRQLEHGTRLIKSDWSDSEFENSLVLSRGRNLHRRLSFMLSYIFQRDLRISGPGYLSEAHSRVPGDSMPDGQPSPKNDRGGGVVSFNRDWWSDGMLRVAKLVHQILIADGRVILLEEPEMGIEPRALRRFLAVLTWIATPGPRSESEDPTTQGIEQEWKAWLANRPEGTPSWEVIREPKASQFFLTSHSSLVLNHVLQSPHRAKVFECFPSWVDTSHDPADQRVRSFKPNSNLQIGKQTVAQESLCSKIRDIDGTTNHILNELGVSGSDLLQCNGVVWVEGPSDAIYLSKWLEMHAKENGASVFTRGEDFEFQMYGGALLDAISVGSPEDEDLALDKGKIVKMSSFSRNAYLIIDSDAIHGEDGKVYDKSNFVPAKAFVRKEIENLQRQGHRVGLWYDEGNTDLRTIEDYLDEDSLALATPTASKRKLAQRRVQSWNETKKIRDFHVNLATEIEALYKMIQSWQPSTN